jgi:hypothetical protein
MEQAPDPKLNHPVLLLPEAGSHLIDATGEFLTTVLVPFKKQM